MTLFDHERTKRLDALPRVIKLASLLCGVPEAAIRDLDASDFERLAEEILSSRPA